MDGFPLRNPHLKNTGVVCGEEVQRVFAHRVRTAAEIAHEIRKSPKSESSIPHFYRRPTEITQTDNGPHVYTALHHFFNQSLTIIIAITVIIIFLLLFRFSFSRNGDTRV